MGRLSSCNFKGGGEGKGEEENAGSLRRSVMCKVSGGKGEEENAGSLRRSVMCKVSGMPCNVECILGLDGNERRNGVDEGGSVHCGTLQEAVTSLHSSALLEESVVEAIRRLWTWILGCQARVLQQLHTRTFNPVPAVSVGGSSVHGARSCPQDASPNGCRPPPSFSRGAGSSSDMLRMSFPPPSTSPLTTTRQTMPSPAANISVAGSEEGGRQVWESCQRQMRQMLVENLTNGVSRMRVGPAGEKGGKHPFWSVEEMLKLARAKRDQQAHFEGMSHNYGRMHNREWKLQDLPKHLLEVGVSRTTDDIGKKWDNLFQQYKKVQRYQNASGGKKFFNLTPALKMEEGFGIEKRIYDEIDTMSKGNKTVNPDNNPDTSAGGGVQMSHSPSVVGESTIGGDGNNDDGASARESGFSAGSMRGNYKRKNIRQQTFDAIDEVIDKHCALMVDTVEGPSKRQYFILEWQCDILEREVDAQQWHYEASDEVNRLMCTTLLEIAEAIRDRS
ncbi:hypothetical protein CBR_g38395 [Chara braunii]|uniref:Myb/SANT-like DNA-binding domain-containing protein n=1 Tax=Chara braunii TaxID=69332 RepID=A0A388JNK3_CHABU|nr:hypothetical protein CBR_g38395 [Chara braunii]|eukprot:GBG59367.1 hypothetical protein CBR_g38395 [Chara braunii]